jgi:hypothetical protein
LCKICSCPEIEERKKLSNNKEKRTKKNRKNKKKRACVHIPKVLINKSFFKWNKKAAHEMRLKSYTQTDLIQMPNGKKFSFYQKSFYYKHTAGEN